MTTAHSLEPEAAPTGPFSYRGRLKVELDRSRTLAADAASRLAILCRSNDATPAGLEEAAKVMLDALGWLLGATALSIREP
jgi:hypothetical protein